MSLSGCCHETLRKGRCAAWFVAAAGSLFLVGGLVWWILARTQPPGVDTARATLRYSNLAEIRAADHTAMTTAEVLDKAKGIYRIPVTNAVELFLQLWQEPAAGRADLLARIEKATAKPPEKPSEYE